MNQPNLVPLGIPPAVNAIPQQVPRRIAINKKAFDTISASLKSFSDEEVIALAKKLDGRCAALTTKAADVKALLAELART